MKLNNKLLLLIIIALVLNIMSCGNDKDQSEEEHIHNWNEVERTSASCKENGVLTYICVDCEEVKNICNITSSFWKNMTI